MPLSCWLDTAVLFLVFFYLRSVFSVYEVLNVVQIDKFQPIISHQGILQKVLLCDPVNVKKKMFQRMKKIFHWIL